MTGDEIIEDFPELEKADIRACLAYAADRERHAAIVQSALGVQTFPQSRRHRGIAYHVAQESVSWRKLGELYKSNPTLPLWVMNTTEGQKGTYPNMYNLYELTPFSYGSARHGYHEVEPPLDSISYGVRASAAFFDKQGAVGSQQKALELFGKLIPAATWGVPIEQPDSDVDVAEVRLSDGGGADNLGLMSLLRRGLDQIIVVDTAEDIEGRMEDLCWDRKALEEEGYVLALPALGDLDEVCGAGKEKAYNVSEWKNPVITGEIRPMRGRQTGVLKHVKLFWIKAAWNEYDVNEVANSIRKTSVGPHLIKTLSPEYEKLTDEERDMIVEHIKGTKYLGECGNAPGQISCWLPVYFAHYAGPHIGRECMKKHAADDDCFIDFPQHKTVNSTFDSDTYQFWAYRELARSAASLIYLDDRGELATRSPQCIQPKRDKWEKGRRPNDWNKEGWEANESKCTNP